MIYYYYYLLLLLIIIITIIITIIIYIYIHNYIVFCRSILVASKTYCQGDSWDLFQGQSTGRYFFCAVNLEAFLNVAFILG